MGIIGPEPSAVKIPPTIATMMMLAAAPKRSNAKVATSTGTIVRNNSGNPLCPNTAAVVAATRIAVPTTFGMPHRVWNRCQSISLCVTSSASGAPIRLPIACPNSQSNNVGMNWIGRNRLANDAPARAPTSGAAIAAPTTNKTIERALLNNVRVTPQRWSRNAAKTPSPTLMPAKRGEAIGIGDVSPEAAQKPT